MPACVPFTTLTRTQISPLIRSLSERVDSITGTIDEGAPVILDQTRVLLERLNQASSGLNEVLKPENRAAVGAILGAARNLAGELRKTEPNGVLYADQWNNLDNRKAHYVSTGPEIWQQTNGKVDGFICSIGTGGTIAGVSAYLREKKPGIVIGVADPHGAAMYNVFAHGEAKSTEGGSITEGIGLGRVTRIIENVKVDKPYLVSDEEAVPLIFDLLEHEGLCVGGSSGINLAGAIRLARELGPGHTIVTVLADYGMRYQSKLFNPAFLRSKGLPVPMWLERKADTAVPFVKV